MEIHQGVSGGERCASVISSQRQEQNTELLKYWCQRTDKGNKQKLSERKVDILSTKQKLQREEGRFEAIRYFDNIKEDKLTWAEALFSDDKGPTGGGKADSTDDECHHQKELLSEL